MMIVFTVDLPQFVLGSLEIEDRAEREKSLLELIKHLKELKDAPLEAARGALNQLKAASV